ncbi:DUF2073 domain-containing protein [Methanopyrus sp.]
MTGGEVKVEVLAKSALERMSTEEVVEYVIEKTRDGSVIVLEGQLDPETLTQIIRETMENVDPEKFTGVDIYVVPPKAKTDKGLFDRLLGRQSEEGMTVISPADVLKGMKKGKDFITLKLG